MFTYFWEEARRRGQSEDNRQEKWPSIIQVPDGGRWSRGGQKGPQGGVGTR